MQTTIPASASLDEAQHWLTLEEHLGVGKPAAGAREALRGAPLPRDSEEWLRGLIGDPECGTWCRKILERTKR